MTKPLTSSGVSVTGQDTAEIIRRTIKRLAERQEQAELAARIEADRCTYGEKETVWILVKPITTYDGNTLYYAETVAEVPGVGCHAKTDRAQSTVKMAQAELRLKMARLWAAKKISTYDAARERAAKVTFMQEIIPGDG